MVKKLFLCFCTLFTFFCSYSIPEFKVYSNGDYGMDLEHVIDFKDWPSSCSVRDVVVGKDGSLYLTVKCSEVRMLDGSLKKCDAVLCKMNPKGKLVWIKTIDGTTFYEMICFDDQLLVRLAGDSFSYSGTGFSSGGRVSNFFLKIDKDNGNLLNYIEFERDNFVDDSFFPFANPRKGYAISPEGDLWFMYDINENYSRVNKDYPVNFDRHGGNDKCLFVLNKNLEIKKLFCLGSEGNDETFFIESEYLIPFMTFVQDTLYMYIPFKGKECNVSLDPENPVVVENASFLGKASVAFCKYLVKGDKIELLTYKVSMSSDGQFKSFAVNSDNKLIGMKRETLWDTGEEYYYEIFSDLTYRKLDGYAYVPLKDIDHFDHLWFDCNDDIIRNTYSLYYENKFNDEIILPNYRAFGVRAAKYDGKTLLNKWVIEFVKAYGFYENSNSGNIFVRMYEEADFDPSDATYIAYKEYSSCIAKYIETYRVKTLSDSVSIVVNGGKDMVRHGEDAEIVVSADNGYYIKSIITSRGDNLSLSADGRCIIKNVREPIELFFNAGQGDNSVEQTDAVALGVYPNPVKDVLYVKDADGSSFLITDFDGKTVCEGVVSDGRINVSHIANGVYVLTLKKGVGSFSTKLIKE